MGALHEQVNGDTAAARAAAALEKARKAQPSWQAFSLSQRCAWLKKFQKLVFAQADRIIEAIRADTGKPAAEAFGIEIGTVLMTAHYYRRKAKRFLKPKWILPHWMFLNKRVTVERYPYGVVAILGPSNLPFSLTIGDALPALLAGNSVVIKPSEWTPKAAQIGLELALEAGLPENVLQILPGGKEEGSALIEGADCVFFTGSTAVGRIVAEQCGRLLKPCVLELGGKAPMIVLDDADLERAARACVWGRFAHSGQHCIAVERVYVDHKIAGPFTDSVVALTQQLREEELSPLTLPNAKQRLEALVDDATRRGATVLWQGTKGVESPTILSNVNHTMRVMKEEAFGPLLPIMAFTNLQNALSLANDSSGGLSSVIFTKGKKVAMEMARKIETGNVSINDVMDHFMILPAPFGGWKLSGLGVRHAAEGLLQFTRAKTIFRHWIPLPYSRRREFWWYPYNEKDFNLLKKLTRFFFG